MLASPAGVFCNIVEKHCKAFEWVCVNIVDNGNADILFGCEVGGHRQGFKRLFTRVWDILRKPFGPHVSFRRVNHYITVFVLLDGPHVPIHGTPQKFTSPVSWCDVDADHYLF